MRGYNSLSGSEQKEHNHHYLTGAYSLASSRISSSKRRKDSIGMSKAKDYQLAGLQCTSQSCSYGSDLGTRPGWIYSQSYLEPLANET